MGDIPEIKTKIWVNRSRKIQIAQFEPVELTSGVQSGFEILSTAKEISDWMQEMESVVTDSLDRQENIERNRIMSIVEKKPVEQQIQAVVAKPAGSENGTRVIIKSANKPGLVKSSKVKEESEKWIPSKNPDVFYRILTSGGFVFKNVRTGETWEGG